MTDEWRQITDVGVDLDGVIYPFVETYSTIHLDYNNIPALPKATKWNFFEDWGMTGKEFVASMEKYIDNNRLFSRGEPEPKTNIGWSILRKAGVKIHVVTSRPRSAWAQTVEWLDEWNLHPDTLHFTDNKTAFSSNPATTASIDDLHEHFTAMRMQGMRAYLMNRPWNSEIKELARVDSFYEFANIVYSLNNPEGV